MLKLNLVEMKDSKPSVSPNRIASKPPAKTTATKPVAKTTNPSKKSTKEENPPEPLNISYDHFVNKPPKNPNDWLKQELNTTSTKVYVDHWQHQTDKKHETSKPVNPFVLKAKTMKFKGLVEERKKQISSMVESETQPEHNLHPPTINNNSRGGDESLLEKFQLTEGNHKLNSNLNCMKSSSMEACRSEEIAFLQLEQVIGRGSITGSTGHKFYTAGLMAMPSHKPMPQSNRSSGILCSRCSREITDSELTAMQSAKHSSVQAFGNQIEDTPAVEVLADNQPQPSVWGAKPLSDDTDEPDLVFTKGSKGWTFTKPLDDSDSDS